MDTIDRSVRFQPTRRQFLAGGGTALTAMLLVACGSAGTAMPADDAPAEQEAAKPAAEPQAEAANINVWVWWPDPVASVEQMGANYEASNPNVSTTVEAVSGYWDKLQASYVGGAGPDIYLMNSVNYFAWSNKEIPADITAQFNADPIAQDFAANAWKTGIDFYTYKGEKMFGVPGMMTSIITLFNEDAVNEGGFAIPSELGTDWNWDLLQEYAIKLTEREGDNITRYGMFAADALEQGWLNYVRANGGDFLSDDLRCVIDGPESAEAWNFCVDLALKHRVSPSRDQIADLSQGMAGRGGHFALFGSGQVILWTAASNNVKFLNEAWPGSGFTWDYGYVAASPNTGNPGGTTNIVGWCVNSNTKTPDQTWGVFANMMTKDSQDILAQADVLRPARDDSAQLYYDPEVTDGPANRIAAFEMFQWTTNLPTHDVVSWGEMLGPMGVWAPQIFAGSVGVEEGLKNMADETNALFDAATS